MHLRWTRPNLPATASIAQPLVYEIQIHSMKLECRSHVIIQFTIPMQNFQQKIRLATSTK